MVSTPWTAWVGGITLASLLASLLALQPGAGDAPEVQMVQVFDLLACRGSMLHGGDPAVPASCRRWHATIDDTDGQPIASMIPDAESRRVHEILDGDRLPYNVAAHAAARLGPGPSRFLPCFLALVLRSELIRFPRDGAHLAVPLCRVHAAARAHPAAFAKVLRTKACAADAFWPVDALQKSGFDRAVTQASGVARGQKTKLLSMPRGSGLSIARAHALQVVLGCDNSEAESRQIIAHEMLHPIVHAMLGRHHPMRPTIAREGAALWHRAAMNRALAQLYGERHRFIEELLVRACVPLIVSELPFVGDFPWEREAVAWMTEDRGAHTDMETRLARLLTHLARGQPSLR